ncbi:MAG: Pigment production hydroxylase [Sphingomonadales bacterium]|nr:Pigment production hydroxylase [Sphingomonadales bacterium]
MNVALPLFNTAAATNAADVVERDFLSAARDISAIVIDRADATEQLGTMPDDIVDALREAGLFWMIVPLALGGGGTDLIPMMDVIEELSFADGSTGWSFMANVTNTAIAATFCGDDAVDAMFGGNRMAISAGMFGPGGRAVAADGGYRGGGAFSFGSGCAHADWVCGGMFVFDEGGNQRLLDNGLPEIRVAFVPRERAELVRRWDVNGLLGTGSFDFRIPEQMIPRAFTLERTSTIPERGGPIFELGTAAFACAGHAAVALGLMKRALREVVMIASIKKRPMYPDLVGNHPVFMQEFASNEAAYHGCREYLHKVFADAQRSALAGESISAEQRARFRQVTTWVHALAADIVRRCHMWAGSDAIRTNSRLGRCLRDMYVATQHVFVDPVTLADSAPAIMARWSGPHLDRTSQSGK